jgi:hypothetical protein
MEKLVVIDINGVIAKKVFKSEISGIIFEDGQLNLHGNRTKVMSMDKSGCIIARWHLDDFFNEIRTRYHLAIFSSCRAKNGRKILDLIAPQEKFLFTWFRDHCKNDPDYRLKPEVEQFDSIKLLDDIIQSSEINECRRFTYKNVLMIDDSKMKMRFNPESNYIIVNSFDYKKFDNTLEDLPDMIAEKFEALTGDN